MPRTATFRAAAVPMLWSLVRALMGDAWATPLERVEFESASQRLVSGGLIRGDPIQGYLAKPDGSGPFPAVVGLHGCAGMHEGHYVTLDCHTRFVARGRVGVPLDAHVHLLKQTKGGLVFFEGHCEQDGEICYAFTGTLKRVTRPNAPAMDDDGARR